MTISRIRKNIFTKHLFSIILVIGVILGMIMIPYTYCQASSATITLDTDNNSVTIGDEVLISVNLSSEAEIGDFETYISYDSDVLEFQSEASFIAGDEGLLKISDLNVANGEYSRKYIIKFIAKEVGTSDISLVNKPSIYDFETGNTMSISANNLNIQVSAAKTASKNANLKSLKISSGTLTPTFDPDITTYTTDVTNVTDKLIISAISEDKAATVTIEGNDKLINGTNKITIVVKAESGHIKKYTIDAMYEDNVQKAETSETVDTETADDNNTMDEYNEKHVTPINNVIVTKNGDNIYIQNGFRYQISTIKDESDIPDGYIKTTIIVNEITIDAYTPEDDLESEYLLLYAKNEEGDLGLYQYDRVEKTIQRYTGNNNSSKKMIMSDEIIHSEEYKDKLTTMAIIIAILGAITITMSIALIHCYTKSKDL